jgi:hypothetical protein
LHRDKQCVSTCCPIKCSHPGRDACTFRIDSSRSIHVRFTQLKLSPGTFASRFSSLGWISPPRQPPVMVQATVQPATRPGPSFTQARLAGLQTRIVSSVFWGWASGEANPRRRGLLTAVWGRSRCCVTKNCHQRRMTGVKHGRKQKRAGKENYAQLFLQEQGKGGISNRRQQFWCHCSGSAVLTPATVLYSPTPSPSPRASLVGYVWNGSKLKLSSSLSWRC